MELIGLKDVNADLEFLRSWVSEDKSIGIAVGKKGAFHEIKASGNPGIKGPDTDADLYGICGNNEDMFITGGEGGMWYCDNDALEWNECWIDGKKGFQKGVLFGDIAYNPDEDEWRAIDQRQGYYFSDDGINWVAMGKDDKRAKNLQALCYSSHYGCFIASKANRIYKFDKSGNMKPFHRCTAGLKSGHIVRAFDVSNESEHGMAMVTRTIEVTGPEFDTWKFKENPILHKKNGSEIQVNLLSVTGVLTDGYRYACGEDGAVIKFKIQDIQNGNPILVYSNLTWATNGSSTLTAKGAMTGIMALSGNDGKTTVYISGVSIKAYDGKLYSIVKFDL